MYRLFHLGWRTSSRRVPSRDVMPTVRYSSVATPGEMPVSGVSGGVGDTNGKGTEGKGTHATRARGGGGGRGGRSRGTTRGNRRGSGRVSNRGGGNRGGRSPQQGVELDGSHSDPTQMMQREQYHDERRRGQRGRRRGGASADGHVRGIERDRSVLGTSWQDRWVKELAKLARYDAQGALPLLRNSPLSISIKACNPIITAAERQKKYEVVREVVQLMDHIPRPPRARQVYHLCKSLHPDLAWEYYERYKEEGGQVTQALMSAIITSSVNAKKLEFATKAYNELRAANIEPDEITCGAFLNACAKTRDYESARKLIEEMLSLGMKLNVIHFNCFVEAMEGVHQGETMILDWMEEQDVKPDSITYATLLRHAFFRGDFEASKMIVERILTSEAGLVRTQSMWMLRCYGLCGRVVEGLRWLEEIGEGESMKAHYDILWGASRAPDFEGAMQVYDVMERKGLPMDDASWSSLMKAADGDIDHTRHVSALMREKQARHTRSTLNWMLLTYQRLNDAQMCREVYAECVWRQHVQPSAGTLQIFLNLALQRAKPEAELDRAPDPFTPMEIAHWAYGELCDRDLKPTVEFGTSLISLLALIGGSREAALMSRDLVRRGWVGDLPAYGVAMQMYADEGRCDRAVELLMELVNLDMTVDEQLVSSLLHTCAISDSMAAATESMSNLAEMKLPPLENDGLDHDAILDIEVDLSQGVTEAMTTALSQLSFVEHSTKSEGPYNAQIVYETDTLSVLRYLHAMAREDVAASHLTYLSVLIMSARTGLPTVSREWDRVFASNKYFMHPAFSCLREICKRRSNEGSK